MMLRAPMAWTIAALTAAAFPLAPTSDATMGGGCLYVGDDVWITWTPNPTIANPGLQFNGVVSDNSGISLMSPFPLEVLFYSWQQTNEQTMENRYTLAGYTERETCSISMLPCALPQGPNEVQAFVDCLYQCVVPDQLKAMFAPALHDLEDHQLHTALVPEPDPTTSCI